MVRNGAKRLKKKRKKKKKVTSIHRTFPISTESMRRKIFCSFSRIIETEPKRKRKNKMIDILAALTFSDRLQVENTFEYPGQNISTQPVALD